MLAWWKISFGEPGLHHTPFSYLLTHIDEELLMPCCRGLEMMSSQSKPLRKGVFYKSMMSVDKENNTLSWLCYYTGKRHQEDGGMGPGTCRQAVSLCSRRWLPPLHLHSQIGRHFIYTNSIGNSKLFLKTPNTQNVNGRTVMLGQAWWLRLSRVPFSCTLSPRKTEVGAGRGGPKPVASGDRASTAAPGCNQPFLAPSALLVPPPISRPPPVLQEPHTAETSQNHIETRQKPTQTRRNLLKLGKAALLLTGKVLLTTARWSPPGTPAKWHFKTWRAALRGEGEQPEGSLPFWAKVIKEALWGKAAGTLASQNVFVPLRHRLWNTPS